MVWRSLVCVKDTPTPVYVFDIMHTESNRINFECPWSRTGRLNSKEGRKEKRIPETCKEERRNSGTIAHRKEYCGQAIATPGALSVSTVEKRKKKKGNAGRTPPTHHPALSPVSCSSRLAALIFFFFTPSLPPAIIPLKFFQSVETLDT